MTTAALQILSPSTPAQRRAVVSLLSGAIVLKGVALHSQGQLAEADISAWVGGQQAEIQSALEGAEVSEVTARMVASALETVGVSARTIRFS